MNVINIEISTYCNRRCSYCPMSIYPREQKYMSKDLFMKLINELKLIDYCGLILLNFFNEPLFDEHLNEKIRYVKNILPNVRIAFNTNGDLLTKEKLNELWESGLNQIFITLHTNPNEKYIDEQKRNELKKFLIKLDMESQFERRSEIPNRNITVDVNLSNDRRILICCNNWQEYGNDRGGTLKELRMNKRTKPCVNPLREIFIAYDGKIKPCCNIYFNSDDIYGNANEDSLIDIYFNEQIIKFRRELFTFSVKKRYCATCNTEDNGELSSKNLRDKIIEDTK